jgi:hypothetical protein
VDDLFYARLISYQKGSGGATCSLGERGRLQGQEKNWGGVILAEKARFLGVAIGKVFLAFSRVKVYVTVDVNHLLKITCDHSRLLPQAADTSIVASWGSCVSRSDERVS